LLFGIPSALLWLLGSRLASAAPPPSLDYRAPAGCPDSASFVAAVESRGASFAAGPASRLLVEIASGEGGFVGSVQVQSEGEASGPRRVHATSCAEVSDALAVVTAIALQREAEPTAPAAVAAPAPVAAVAAPVAASAPVAAPVQLVMSQQTLDVPAGKLKLDYISTSSLLAGVQLGAVRGLVLPRFDFSLSRINLITTPDARAIVLGNEFRVRWTLLGPTTRHAADFDTRLWGLKAGIGGCTPFSYDPAGLILKSCAEIAGGTMFLETHAADGSKTQEKMQPLATASAELDAQYNVSRRVHLELRAGGEMWLGRISAERPDGSRLFQSPLFNGYLSVGIGLHF
jgi:hypothetical protein